MKTILAINPGSTSYKCSLFAQGQSFMRHTHDVTTVAAESKDLLAYLEEVKVFLAEKRWVLDAIAIRVVAPGTRFQSHQVIDAVFQTLLHDREYAAPLHIPKILRTIVHVREQFAGVPLLAISDSAFHHTLPMIARSFSLSPTDADEIDLYRFGYHGISVSAVLDRVHALLGTDPSRVIVCHVGGGVSVTAVKDGISVETTGGYGPLSGVPTCTRAGELDVSAVLALMERRNFKPREASLYLQHSGGLVGLGGTSDIRTLLDRKAHGDVVADTALQYFAYQIQKAIASATVAIGGVDTLVFTGTAAVRNAAVRELLVEKIGYLGVAIDQEKNEVAVGTASAIHPTGAEVKVVVIPSEELWKMAAIADTLL